MDFDQLSDEEKKAYTEMNRQTYAKPSQKRNWVSFGFPDRKRNFFSGLLGLPIERRQRPIQAPLVIFSFIAIITYVFLSSRSQGLASVVNHWGFIPSQYYRHSFLTVITSFFLHASWMHLLGNAYYFYIFGDDVEDDMTLFEFIRFLFWGHVCGLALHCLMADTADLPLVGASAGISALLGYYMIRFPKRQITYMVFFFYVWVHIPAFGVFLWKFGWESFIAASGVPTRVAHWAHLGGAVWGIIAALGKKKRQQTL